MITGINRFVGMIRDLSRVLSGSTSIRKILNDDGYLKINRYFCKKIYFFLFINLKNIFFNTISNVRVYRVYLNF